MTSDHTLLILKPDAVRRGLVGSILTQFELHGFGIERMVLARLTPEQMETHYAEHRGKPFFGPLSQFMCSGPAVLLVVCKMGAVLAARSLIGATKCSEAGLLSIRGRFGDKSAPTHENLIHASDSPASAAREIRHFFPDLRDLYN